MTSALTPARVKKLKVSELRDELAARGLSTEGLKPALLDRLLGSIEGGEAGDREDTAPAEDSVDVKLAFSDSTAVATSSPAEIVENNVPPATDMAVIATVTSTTAVTSPSSSSLSVISDLPTPVAVPIPARSETLNAVAPEPETRTSPAAVVAPARSSSGGSVGVEVTSVANLLADDGDDDVLMGETPATTSVTGSGVPAKSGVKRGRLEDGAGVDVIVPPAAGAGAALSTVAGASPASGVPAVLTGAVEQQVQKKGRTISLTKPSPTVAAAAAAAAAASKSPSAPGPAIAPPAMGKPGPGSAAVTTRLITGVGVAAGAAAKPVAPPVFAATPPVVEPSARTCSLRVTNFVRPFTLDAAKKLMASFGTLAKSVPPADAAAAAVTGAVAGGSTDGFWMDSIKTTAVVTYETVEQAEAARLALYGLRWPQVNGAGGRQLLAEYSAATADDAAAAIAAAATAAATRKLADLEAAEAKAAAAAEAKVKAKADAEAKVAAAAAAKAKAKSEADAKAEAKAEAKAAAAEARGRSIMDRLGKPPPSAQPAVAARAAGGAGVGIVAAAAAAAAASTSATPGGGGEGKAKTGGAATAAAAAPVAAKGAEEAEVAAVSLDDLFRRTSSKPQLYFLPRADAELVGVGGSAGSGGPPASRAGSLEAVFAGASRDVRERAERRGAEFADLLLGGDGSHSSLLDVAPAAGGSYRGPVYSNAHQSRPPPGGGYAGYGGGGGGGGYYGAGFGGGGAQRGGYGGPAGRPRW